MAAARSPPSTQAPEQIARAPVTTATDVYSLGVVLYELLTGTRPFAVDVVVLTALKKAPSQRYAAVAALGEDLRRHLRHEPILARDESAWSRASKFIRRNRLPVAATTLVAAALLAGLSAALWEAHVARDESARAAEISRFIGSVFQQADTSENGYADIRAVDLLVGARDRIEQELRGRAALQVDLMCIVANSLYSLGANEEAGSTFERARALASDPARVLRGSVLMTQDRP